MKNALKRMPPSFSTSVRPALRYLRALTRLRNSAGLALFSLRLQASRHPQTFQQITLHKMAYDRNPLLTTFADKVAVRDYVAEKVGPEILSYKLGVFSTLESVRREELPRNFVLKANHGSGASIICWEQAPRGTVLRVPTDSRPTWERFLIHPDDLDWDAAVRLSSRWMRQNYYWRLGKFPEWAYKNIAPQLLVEEVLIHKGGLPEDYRFYMVGGVCKLIQVDGSRFTQHERELYTPDWKRVSEETGQVVEREGRAPRLLGQMLEIAAALSTEVDFVRVDLYQTDKGVVFGELSNYPEGGVGLTYLPNVPTEWVAPQSHSA